MDRIHSAIAYFYFSFAYFFKHGKFSVVCNV